MGEIIAEAMRLSHNTAATDMFIPQTVAITPYEHLSTLVEHKSVYALTHYELNIFETHHRSERVPLVFSDFVLTAMLRGKKVMRLGDATQSDFDYLPGESVIVPGHEPMHIDFPEATSDNPTQCIAIAIPNEQIRSTVDMLNEQSPKAERGDLWQVDMSLCHLENSPEIVYTIDRLMRIARENHPNKDTFAQFALQELLIRLMQTQARRVLFEQYSRYATVHRFAHVLQYIQQHLTEPLSIEALSEQACMSKAHFFRCFKQEFGITPLEYIIRERMKLAKQLLLNPAISIPDAGYKAGFQNLSQFYALFKRQEGITPKQFRSRKTAA